jgi:hypothetical protein
MALCYHGGVTAKRACPVCLDSVLDESGRCGGCGGSLVHDAEDALAGVGIDRELLVRLMEETGTKGHACPGCAFEMTRTQVRGEMVDLCKGCGGMWVDASELARIFGEDLPRRLLPRAPSAASSSPARALKPGRIRPPGAIFSAFAIGGVITVVGAYQGAGPLFLMGLAAGVFTYFFGDHVRVDAGSGEVRWKRGKRTFHVPASSITGVLVGERKWLQYPVYLAAGDEMYRVYSAPWEGAALDAARKLHDWLRLEPGQIWLP